ncbi:MAG TPA: stalk domain-containing protein, partial [Clostridia bacterium]|nr:stalk domain-containing protein [Clostridia bacterium]
MRKRVLLIYIKKFKLLIPVIMLSICFVVAMGIGIAIRIDNQRRTDLIIVTDSKSYSLDNTINVSKLQQRNLLINGQKNEYSNCYLYEKDGIYISAEDLFKNIGVEYKLFNSDSILEAYLPQGTLKIYLGKFDITIDGKPYNLAYPVIIKDGQILLPQDLLNFIIGIDYQVETDENVVYLNYFNDDRKSIIDKVKYIKVKNEDVDNILVSKDMKRLLIKDGTNIYYSATGDIADKEKIDIDLSAKWSLDGETVYWYDEQNDIVNIYTPSNNTTTKIKNPFDSQNGKAITAQFYQSYELYEYKYDKNYKRIAFKNSATNEEFVIIERKGTRVFENSAVFSPDRSKIMYLLQDKGYYVIKGDGTSNSLVGLGISAKWINNDKIIIQNEEMMKHVYSFTAKTKILTTKEYGYLSTTINGECLFYIDRDVYAQNGNKDQKLYQLPGNSDYIYSVNKQGPFINITSGDEGGVYLTNGDNVDYISSSKLLIKNANFTSQEEIYKNSFTTSPNGNRTVMIGRDSDKLLLWIFDNKSGNYKKMISFK